MGAVIAAVFLALLLWAAWGDVKTYRISNALVVALLVLFGVAFAAGSVERDRILEHLGVGALALAVGMGLFARNLIGGGDAKLFAVLALWAGWPEVIRLAFVTALAGGAVSAVVLLRSRRAAKEGAVPAGEVKRPPIVPYGVAIAVAGLDYWIRALAAPFLFPFLHL